MTPTFPSDRPKRLLLLTGDYMHEIRVISQSTNNTETIVYLELVKDKEREQLVQALNDYYGDDT
jgi:hypothetical protein